jgi:hypothetical protein
MTDLRIDYQLRDEVRVSLGRLAAEFVSIVAAQNASRVTGLTPAAASTPTFR